MKKLALFLFAFIALSCTDNDDKAVVVPPAGPPQLIVKFKFDPTQVRLNNLGFPSTVAAGNAAQSPVFNGISSHYLEFSPDALMQLGDGTVLYHAPETIAGGLTAIDFSQAKIVSENEAFLSIPLSQVASGTYQWVRCSLSYQNFDVNIRNSGVDYIGKVASFVGFRNYIGSHTVGSNSFDVNENRDQGYWAVSVAGLPFSGQAPAGATTVPNPISATSPIEPGSCVVTGKFANNLIITGNETKDVVVTLSLSINNSFEWQEVVSDGKYEPAAGETVKDMGLRGLIPSFQN